MSTKDIITSINRNDGNMFLDIVSSLSLEDLKIVDFNQVDDALLNNIKFPLKEKLAYAKYYNRPIYSKLVKSIIDDPYSSDYDGVLFLARVEESVRYKLLDILVIRTSSLIQADSFMFQLKMSNLLNDYIQYLKNGKDTRAKVQFALYFGYLDDFYPDHYQLAQMIVKTNGYRGLISARTDALVKLASLTNDKMTLEYINGIIEEIVKLEAEEYYNETYGSMGIDVSQKEKDKHIKKKLGYILKRLKK